MSTRSDLIKLLTVALIPLLFALISSRTKRWEEKNTILETNKFRSFLPFLRESRFNVAKRGLLEFNILLEMLVLLCVFASAPSARSYPLISWRIWGKKQNFSSVMGWKELNLWGYFPLAFIEDKTVIVLPLN